MKEKMQARNEKVKILCSGFGYGQGESGIAEYIRNTINLLAERGCKIDLLLPEHDVAFWSDRHKSVTLKLFSNLPRSEFGMLLWSHFILPRKLDIKAYDYGFIPAGSKMILPGFPHKTIITIHDLSRYYHRSAWSKMEKFWVRTVLPIYLRKAGAVVAISENTRNDIIRLMRIDPAKITVNHIGFNVGKYYSSPENDLTVTVKARYGLPDKYVLYVAPVGGEYKNHLNLIRAYEKLPARIKFVHKLVLAGRILTRGQRVLRYAKHSSDRDNIIFTGFIPEEHMPEVFRNASLYAFPALHEGFGIPLVEAMSCGVPVICADSGALPEIGGNAVISFNPQSVDEIYHRIEEVLSDDALRSEMIKSGYTRKEQFNWNCHIDKLLELFRLMP
jgi:glycosyltransferase involved in cell wall biosynthesis